MRTVGASAHVVRGAIVSRAAAIAEYEEAYRIYLRARPSLVRFLTTVCGNVYDDNVGNVHDDDYEQPHTAMNHYQDISVRRVIAELVDDPAWPDVVETPDGDADLIDLGTGAVHRVPRARGFAVTTCSRSASRTHPATSSTRPWSRSTIRR